MNKLFLIIIFCFCCSACINEENILPAKDKLSSKVSSNKNNDRSDNDEGDDEEGGENEKDKEKNKGKDKDKDRDKDKKEKKDDDDDDDKNDKDKEKKEKDDKKNKDNKFDDDKDGKKDKTNSDKSFFYECNTSRSFADAEVRNFFKEKVWTAMLKNNIGQLEAYRLTTSHNTITTSFVTFSDCRSEGNSYIAEVINYSWSGRAINTGNAEDSFIIGCMNNSYFEATYSNGKILHFYNEDQIKSINIDRCKLKLTQLD